MSSSSRIEQARLSWASRRGMLELDLLLGPYTAVMFSTLSDADKSLYEQLLECTDQELYQWLMGSQPAPEVFQPLISKIITYAQTGSAT